MTVEILEHAKRLKGLIDELKGISTLFNGNPKYRNICFKITGVPDIVTGNSCEEVIVEVKDTETVDKIKDAIYDRLEELQNEFAKL